MRKQVERSHDVAGQKEQRRKERTESGGGRAQFVSDLQSAVFRRKINEVCASPTPSPCAAWWRRAQVLSSVRAALC